MTNSIDDLKATEDRLVNMDKHEGTKKKIEVIETIEVPSSFNERGKQWVLRIATEPLESTAEIRASQLFNLKENDEGSKAVGWSTQGKLQKFLDKMKVKHPKELTGKLVLIVRRGDFAGFNIE